MQAKELIRFISDPSALNESSVKELQTLVNDFPYFGSAHILLSLASKKWDTSIYQQSLKKTAIVVTNRARLFELIHGLGEEDASPATAPVQAESIGPEPQNAKEELDILKAAELSTEPETGADAEAELPEPAIEKEIGRSVVESFVEKKVLKTHEAGKIETPAQPGSFGDWLAYLKKNNGQPYEQIREEVNREKLKQQETPAGEQPAAQLADRKKKNQALIDKIIEKNPGLIRSKEEPKFFTPEVKAKESLLNNEHLVTETLARIYALQGNVNKAIRAYQILSLKNPQKSAYFATLIEKLKNNQ
jgi:hypothetical protein